MKLLHLAWMLIGVHTTYSMHDHQSEKKSETSYVKKTKYSLIAGASLYASKKAYDAYTFSKKHWSLIQKGLILATAAYAGYKACPYLLPLLTKSDTKPDLPPAPPPPPVVMIEPTIINVETYEATPWEYTVIPTIVSTACVLTYVMLSQKTGIRIEA